MISNPISPEVIVPCSRIKSFIEKETLKSIKEELTGMITAGAITRIVQKVTRKLNQFDKPATKIKFFMLSFCSSWNCFYYINFLPIRVGKIPLKIAFALCKLELKSDQQAILKRN